MSPGFFQTVGGKKFFESSIPEAISQIKRLNKNLEKIISLLEESTIQNNEKKEEGDKDE